MGMRVGEKPRVVGDGMHKIGINLDPIPIKGRVQKPEAVYVLPRTNLNGDSFTRVENGNSLGKIVKSLDDPHFDKQIGPCHYL